MWGRRPALVLFAVHAVIGVALAALMGAVAGTGCAGQWMCSPGLLAAVYGGIYGIGVAVSGAVALGLWLALRRAVKPRLWVMGAGPILVALAMAGWISWG